VQQIVLKHVRLSVDGVTTMSILKCRLFWSMAVGVALTAGAAAEGIDGVYRVEGHSPGSNEVYKGQAQIKKTGDTYTVVWRIGESGHVGTGILRGNVLSIFFQPLDRRAAPGIASFLIADDKVTEGTWTVLGGNSVGVERWVPDRGL
jgi:hypothetical protein